MALGLREGTTEWTLGEVSAPPPMEKRAAGVRTSKGLKKAAFPSICLHLSERRSEKGAATLLASQEVTVQFV